MPSMPSYAAIAPIAQHRGREPQLACDLDQRPTAARQQGDRLRLELIRKMTPFLAHSTPSRSPRSLAKVSTNSEEAQSSFHCWVEFAELDAGVLGGELPIGRDGGSVAPELPGLDVALQRRLVADPVRQVAAEGAQLDFGHVQPGAVLGRVVDLEPVCDALGPLGRER